MNFELILSWVSKIKKLDLPGEDSFIKMAPSYRRENLDAYRSQMKFAKLSAVTTLLYPDQKMNCRLVLILRKQYKGVHGGQVGLPGGRKEDKDKTLLNTALRETEEEIGIATDQIEVVRNLSKIYIPPSNFSVQPYLTITRRTPLFNPQIEEVEKVITPELSSLLDENTITRKRVKSGKSNRDRVPGFYLDNHFAWGATAMILSEVRDLINTVYKPHQK